VGASVLVVVLLCAPAAFPVHREPVGQLAPAGRSLSLPATKAPTSAASPGAAGGYRSAEGAASGTSPSVQTFDLRNNTLVNGSVAFPNCLAPGGAGVPSVGALVPAGADEHVFISCQTSDTVVVLSEANRSVLRILPVGAYPSGMAFDNSTGEVFVANFQSNNVSVISTSNLTVVRSIAVGLRPLTVTLDAGARELLVRNVGSDSISVIADQNDTVTTTVTVGGLSVGAVYDAARGEAYFTGVFLGYPQGSVSVFSDATNTIVAQILVGLDPDEPRFATNELRRANRVELDGIIERAFASEAAGVWMARLDEAGIPAGLVKTLDQVYQSPQVEHLGLIDNIEHPTLGTIRLPGSPLTYSDSPPSPSLAPPLLGQHNALVMRWLGLGGAEAGTAGDLGGGQATVPAPAEVARSDEPAG